MCDFHPEIDTKYFIWPKYQMQGVFNRNEYLYDFLEWKYQMLELLQVK